MTRNLALSSRAVLWARDIAFVFILCLVDTGIGAEEVPRVKLSGVITTTGGEAVADANVFIFTAGPKEGAGVLCPSCYPDCRKRTTTDAEGKFAIESLDPKLLFRVLVAAKNLRPEFVAKVDPAAKPITVALKPVSGGDAPNQRLRGRVVNAEGKAVSGAVVRIRGVSRGSGTRFGGNSEIDPVAVTDNAGEFVINGQGPFDAAGVDVEARGLAKGIFQRLTTGDVIHELKLTEGVSVKGRVVKDGKPLSRVEIGIAGADRRSEIFVGDFVVATDEDGQFLFVNLPARTQYYVYGLMKSLASHGAIPERLVRTQEDGSTLEAGDLKVEQSYTVAGKLRLTDGQPLPETTRVLISREGAWDTQQIEVDSEGRFSAGGVPSEPIHLSVRVTGYRFSLRNASLDPLNPYRLIGRVQTNKTDLIVELEPGERRERLDGDSKTLRFEPLRGAETAKALAGDIKVNGTVTDADTGNPLPSFTLTEGRRDSLPERFNWFSTRKSAQSNGAFTIYFSKQSQPPAVLVEAEGYIPKASGPITVAETNMAFALKKGSGPAGVLLDSNGQPVASATVYLTDARNSVYVDGAQLKVRESMYRGTRTVTDSDGRFSFAPLVDAHSIIVVDDAGFAKVRADELERHAEVRLQQWARVNGKLLIGANPGTNETVRLGLAHLPYAHHPRTFSPMSLFLITTTAQDGTFVFERVPPIAVEIYHSPKVRDSRGLVPVSQNTRLALRPGKTSDITLGGKGRPVVGRIIVNDYEGKIDWRADVHYLEPIVPQPAELPDMRALSSQFSATLRAAKTDEEKQTARTDYERRRDEAIEKTKAFYASEAGRRYWFARHRYALNFSQDGRFRVEDVPAGKYTLKVDLHEGSGDSPTRMSVPRIAQLQQEIEVPEAAGGRTDEPFDLGGFSLKARTAMAANKVAPDFEVKTVEDKPIKLSDYKGKFVLLDFWAVWCGPCVAETPNLKETYEAFKDEPRFAMIGLSLDPEVSAPRDYAKKNQLGWIQGFLGDWSKADVPAMFGVEGIPSIFLIGPDGKIVATGLRGPGIKSAVQSALARP